MQLWGAQDWIHLVVSDHGAGFDVEAAKRGPGLGLVSMEERIKLVDGELSIESQPKDGTTIHARVPLPRCHRDVNGRVCCADFPEDVIVLARTGHVR